MHHVAPAAARAAGIRVRAADEGDVERARRQRASGERAGDGPPATTRRRRRARGRPGRGGRHGADRPSSPVRPAIQIGTARRCTPAAVVTRPPSCGDRTALEHRHEQLDAGVERRRPGLVVGRRLVEQRVLAVAVDAEAERQHDASARQPVQRRRRLGDELHPLARQRRDHRPDDDALGGDGDRGERDPRVGERLAACGSTGGPRRRCRPTRCASAAPATVGDHAPARPAPRTARSTVPIVIGRGP